MNTIYIQKGVLQNRCQWLCEIYCNMIIKAGTFASLQNILGKKAINAWEHWFISTYLQTQKLIRWHFHYRVTCAFVRLNLPTVRWSKHTLLTGVNVRFCLSQGQVQLASLCNILRHFSFSLRGLESLETSIIGSVFDICSGVLWKALGPKNIISL